MLGITVAFASGFVVLTIVIVLMRRLIAEPEPQKSEIINFDVGPPPDADDIPLPEEGDRP